MPIIKFNNYKGPGISKEVLEELQVNLLKMVFPVGSTYITQTAINPANEEILGFGTWERLKGKVCLGLDKDDNDLKTIGNTGGEKTHKLTIAEMPSHVHALNTNVNCTGFGSGNSLVRGAGGTEEWKANEYYIKPTGDGAAHNNMQPYEVVGYMWIRIN